MRAAASDFIQAQTAVAHDFHADEFATLVFTGGKVETGYLGELRQWRGAVPGAGIFVNVQPPAHSMSLSPAE